MKLVEQAKKLPDKPGVYFFLGKKGTILYIGRATSLKKRVASYFQRFLDPRIKEMVENAAKLKFQKTDTVLESIILEANLIKKHWPKYNIKERDNCSFVYVVIPQKMDFPYPMLFRERELEKLSINGKIFGPYQSLGLIKNALRIIRRIFPYSSCKPNSGKACFNYQVGLCPGACVGKISKQEYQKNIKNIILLLEGKKKNLLKKLEKENPDKIKNLEHVRDVALIDNSEIWNLGFRIRNFAQRIEGYDISHLSGKETVGSMVVFSNGEADNTQYRLFKIRGAGNNDLEALREVILRRFHHREWNFPELVVVDGGRPQVDYVFKTLKEKSLNIPLVGISKLADDKLVFPKDMKKNTRELIQSSKSILLKVRNESHRFALNFSRKKRYNRNL
jgi:excinuclease ABC subunit C